MSKIEFDEDVTVLKPMERKDLPPEKGFEAWFHKHSPYSLGTNRLILVGVALLFFLIAAFFFLASIYNYGNKQDEKAQEFQSRVEQTRSR